MYISGFLQTCLKNTRISYIYDVYVAVGVKRINSPEHENNSVRHPYTAAHPCIMCTSIYMYMYMYM